MVLLEPVPKTEKSKKAEKLSPQEFL